MSTTGAPTHTAITAAAIARRADDQASFGSDVHAIPPSTASEGNTNTKWRMPLYIAGRARTVTASGVSANSTTHARAARRLRARPPLHAPIVAATSPTMASARKIAG